MTYREWYEEGRRKLEAAGIEEAALDARLLLEYVCGTNRNDLLVHGERPVEPEQAEKYLEYLTLREKRIPLQHITGEQDFMGLSFRVNEHVLIPRQDTEILVEEVLRELHDGMRVLDMCTGSGCILISLMHYSNGCVGVGADISEEALDVAKENAKRLLSDGETGINDEAEVAFVHSDLFQNITGKFDVIVSNPPYIRSDVISTLMPEVKDHEPMQALDGFEDGLFFYRQIVAESRNYLVRGGRLYFEIGHDQGEQVSDLMRNAGFREIEVVKDYAGLDRVVFGIYIEA